MTAARISPTSCAGRMWDSSCDVIGLAPVVCSQNCSRNLTSLSVKSWWSRRQFQEVREDLFAVFGEDGFGVELHAPNWELLVPDTHHFEFGTRLGDDLQVGGHGVAFDDQRVIPGRRERIGHAGEKRIAGMINGRGLAVHEALGA